jgi:hypothetical protein
MFATMRKSVLAIVLVVGLALGVGGVGAGLSTNIVAVAEDETPAQAGKVGPADPDAARKQLKDSDPQVRLKAAVELSGQPDEEAINVLIELLVSCPD